MLGPILDLIHLAQAKVGGCPMASYENLVKDFTKRTLENLELVENLKADDPDAEVYEVTQLINSLLGLVVLPRQKYLADIPETPLTDLVRQGWAIPRTIVNHPKTPNLRRLIVYLRHAVAHFNIEFTSVDDKNIAGVKVWNVPPNSGTKDWEVQLSLVQLRDIVKRFGVLLQQVP